MYRKTVFNCKVHRTIDELFSPSPFPTFFLRVKYSRSSSPLLILSDSTKQNLKWNNIWINHEDTVDTYVISCAPWGKLSREDSKEELYFISHSSWGVNFPSRSWGGTSPSSYTYSHLTLTSWYNETNKETVGRNEIILFARQRILMLSRSSQWKRWHPR